MENPQLECESLRDLGGWVGVNFARPARVTYVCSGPSCSFVPPVSCSPLGRHHHINHFRQLLCPDPFCEVCNSTTAEVNRLLFPEALEDATSSVIPLVSTAPVTDSSFTSSPDSSEVPPGDLIPAPLTEPFPPPPSIFSPNPMTPLADFFLPSPASHSLPLEPKALDSEFPVSHSIPQPLAFPPLLLHDIQKGDPVVQPEATLPVSTVSPLDPTISQESNLLPTLSHTRDPIDSFVCIHEQPTLSVSPPSDCTLTVTQSKSISISLKSVPEKSSPESLGGLSTYVPTIRGSDCSSPSISEFSCWQAHAKNMFLPPLSHSDFQQEQVYLHLPETYVWRDSATKHKEASGLSFPGPNFQALLERQMKKRMAFQILEKKVKEEGPFSKQIWSENRWTSLGNSLQPFDVQVTTAPKTGWDTEGKPEQLRIYQQLLCVKSLGENLHQKYRQLFWGLPSLHSESLVATLLFSSSTSPLESHFVLFNGIHNTSAVKMQDQASPPLPHSHSLPLPSVHPQPLPQTLSQSQPLPFTQVNTQAHFQSCLPIIPSSSSSQIRDCGVSFHRSKNESDSHIPTENQHLEWHVLQKQQESLWGLVPVFQKSQETIYPRAPNLPLVSQSSHAYVPVSILPGHFHITCEPQETMELHSPRKIIPRWCLHDYRNVESLALMEPQCKLTEISQQKGRHVHSQFSELQGHSSKDLAKIELSLPGSFHERVPINFQLRKDMRRNLGYILEKSPEDSPQRVSECYLVKGLRAALETSNCVCHSRNYSGNELLNVSRKDTDQNQTKGILRLHMSKKFWQITAGRIPIGVCDSWLADDNTLSFSRSSQTAMENTNSKKNIVGRVYCQITTPDLSFLDPNTRQVLEAHIIRFRMSQRWGLPLRVLESIKFYMLREAKTWPLPQFDIPSSAMHLSGVDSKAEFLKPLEGSSKIFLGDRVRTTNSVPILDCPLPAMSSVDNEGQGVLKVSHSDTDHKPVECIQIAECGSQTFQPLTHSIRAQIRPSEIVPDNTCGPEVSTRQAGAGREPRDENVSSSNTVEMVQGKVMVEKNLEQFAASNLSRDIFDTEELYTLQSQSCDTLTTSELGSSKMLNVNMSKVETALATEDPSTKILAPQDSKLSDLKGQLLSELKFKLGSEEHDQARGCPTDMPFTSDSLTSKASLTQSQSGCSRDMEASQVLHVQVEDSRISKDRQQESWDSKLAFCKCQPKNFPQRKSAKKVRPQDSKARKCKSEDSGVGTSVGRKESHRVEDRKLESPSPLLSQNEQFPPESYFRKKTRQFFQWINSKKKIAGQQASPQQKAKFMSTLGQHQEPVESVATFMSDGPPEAHRLMTTIGKILEEKLACRYGSEVSELSQPQEEIQAQGGPGKRHPSNYRALCDPQQKKRASIKSCSQEALCADQNRLTSVRQSRDRVRHPRKVVTFKDQLFSQSQPPSSLPSGESVSHPSPTCVHQVRQALLATRGDPDESTVFSDLTLLLKQKMLLQHFQGEKFP
ncbi:spermatogenesis-associated protein 31D3-like [Ursus americanus]|uniref:spermatogenesis-associated protein 31D3-like n=1 Tax=Ursus americanus TaxID=9643 RepID=UPI001E6790AC|nr:spermatogenesis-associated protein 31D3-like [Ursus americanus]